MAGHSGVSDVPPGEKQVYRGERSLFTRLDVDEWRLHPERYSLTHTHSGGHKGVGQVGDSISSLLRLSFSAQSESEDDLSNISSTRLSLVELWNDTFVRPLFAKASGDVDSSRTEGAYESNLGETCFQAGLNYISSWESVQKERLGCDSSNLHLQGSLKDTYGRDYSKNCWSANSKNCSKNNKIFCNKSTTCKTIDRLTFRRQSQNSLTHNSPDKSSKMAGMCRNKDNIHFIGESNSHSTLEQDIPQTKPSKDTFVVWAYSDKLPITKARIVREKTSDRFSARKSEAHVPRRERHAYRTFPDENDQGQWNYSNLLSASPTSQSVSRHELRLAKKDFALAGSLDNQFLDKNLGLRDIGTDEGKSIIKSYGQVSPLCSGAIVKKSTTSDYCNRTSSHSAKKKHPRKHRCRNSELLKSTCLENIMENDEEYTPRECKHLCPFSSNYSTRSCREVDGNASHTLKDTRQEITLHGKKQSLTENSPECFLSGDFYKSFSQTRDSSNQKPFLVSLNSPQKSKHFAGDGSSCDSKQVSFTHSATERGLTCSTVQNSSLGSMRNLAFNTRFVPMCGSLPRFRYSLATDSKHSSVFDSGRDSNLNSTYNAVCGSMSGSTLSSGPLSEFRPAYHSMNDTFQGSGYSSECDRIQDSQIKSDYNLICDQGHGSVVQSVSRSKYDPILDPWHSSAVVTVTSRHTSVHASVCSLDSEPGRAPVASKGHSKHKSTHASAVRSMCNSERPSRHKMHPSVCSLDSKTGRAPVVRSVPNSEHSSLVHLFHDSKLGSVHDVARNLESNSTYGLEAHSTPKPELSSVSNSFACGSVYQSGALSRDSRTASNIDWNERYLKSRVLPREVHIATSEPSRKRLREGGVISRRLTRDLMSVSSLERDHHWRNQEHEPEPHTKTSYVDEQ